jgi:hypothetical protein
VKPGADRESPREQRSTPTGQQQRGSCGGCCAARFCSQGVDVKRLLQGLNVRSLCGRSRASAAQSGGGDDHNQSSKAGSTKEVCGRLPVEVVLYGYDTSTRGRRRPDQTSSRRGTRGLGSSQAERRRQRDISDHHDEEQYKGRGAAHCPAKMPCVFPTAAFAVDIRMDNYAYVSEIPPTDEFPGACAVLLS